MTCPMDTELHNVHAPAVFRLLMAPQAMGQTDYAVTMTMLETVILGALFVGQSQGFDPDKVLATLCDRVKGRLELDQGKTIQ